MWTLDLAEEELSNGGYGVGIGLGDNFGFNVSVYDYSPDKPRLIPCMPVATLTISKVKLEITIQPEAHCEALVKKCAEIYASWTSWQPQHRAL